MVHTGQAARDPDLERLTTAVGVGVQPERGVPLGPTVEKVATGGGRWPRGHLLHRLMGQNRSAVGGMRKPQRVEQHTTS